MPSSPRDAPNAAAAEKSPAIVAKAAAGSLAQDARAEATSAMSVPEKGPAPSAMAREPNNAAAATAEARRIAADVMVEEPSRSF